jgi:hypothetical protein
MPTMATDQSQLKLDGVVYLFLLFSTTNKIVEQLELLKVINSQSLFKLDIPIIVAYSCTATELHHVGTYV